jgi:DNA-directed RNA polymerase subunit RPC12/RpoP
MFLAVDDRYAGQLVRCPSCSVTMTAPSPTENARVGASATAESRPLSATGSFRNGVESALAGTGPGPTSTPVRMSTSLPRSVGRRYGFNCPLCSSRLEAGDWMAGTDGQCPTCGSNIVIPILDRYGRLIDPTTREVIKPPPHPVHAYAAAGDRAPQLLNSEDGTRRIQCPKCQRTSSIAADNCVHCGLPFTMEGTGETAHENNGWAIASVVLGVIGLPASCVGVPSVLALIFGALGLVAAHRSSTQVGQRLSIVGMVLGAAGLVVMALMKL